MYKQTSPKVNFPELEKKILDYWKKEKIVEKYLRRNDTSKKRFSFLDGPITANNPMGVHHAWGRTYKDLWQRFYNMRGYRQRFQNGFDCQGLWIEVEVEKELVLKSKKDIENLVAGDKKASIAKFVELCKKRVLKFSKIQTEQSKRLGYFMDWGNSYYTMSDENNYMIWHFLKTCHEKGWVYKGRDSVPWCPRCETAISQHEMLTEDYKEVTHKSIYFKLPVKDKSREFLLVWTTTPWTIPANIAVAVDKKLEYSLVEGATGGDLFWVAKDTVERIFRKSKHRVVKTMKGKELVGLRYQGPFDHLPAVRQVAKKNSQTFHKVVPTDDMIMPITTNEGTGIVHTAVSAGTEDFKLGKKLGLPMIPVITDDASYLKGLGFLSGKNAKDHPDLILDYMVEEDKKESVDWVFDIHDYTHRYPGCWRCKTELVWKVEDEWYIAMDRHPLRAQSSKLKAQSKTLRQQMIEVAKMIKWHPEFGLDRELDWLSNMHDWLISKKNRYWGLTLPIYECGKCGWFDIVGSEQELRRRAVSGWEKFEGHTPHKPYIDEVKIKCERCGTFVSRIDDVGNVWLDAGIVPFSTFVDPKTQNLSYTTDKKYWKDWYPADFITESFPGQFKNWFYSMIAMSAVLEKRNPYQTVLGFASVLGEDSRPMHKSWGNAIEFSKGADKIGVDVMRWTFMRHNPEINILFGYKTTDKVRRKFHLLLWNVYNFFVNYANVDGYKKSKVPSTSRCGAGASQKLSILDEWIMSKLNQLIGSVTDSLNDYDAHTASVVIEEFVNDLSTWYVRRSRGRIGPTVENTDDKIACYKTLHEVLVTLSMLLAPFIPFLSEEIYRNLTKGDSVHLANWPELPKDFVSDQKLFDKMHLVRKICELGHAARKKEGIKVRQPLSKLKVQNSKLKVDDEFIQLIKDELNIKNIEINTGGGELTVEMDTKLTPDLIAEGKARELVRKIQLKRKDLGCRLTEKVEVTISDWPEQFTNYIKKETLTKKIIKGEEFLVRSL